MIQLGSGKNCCGCTACVSICKHKAITMLPDALGFMYPNIDTNKCVECGLCIKICAFNNKYDISENFTNPIAYAGRHIDIQKVETSRSGAIFIALSTWIIEQGGIVYGVGYKNKYKIVHKRATTIEELYELKGSKYVQSDLSNIFLQIKKDLQNGLIVLFSGTPCQTAGLRSYIGKLLCKKLYLVDIICHGVPSPKVWEDNVKHLEYKYNTNFTEVNFRNKLKYGWNSHIETYVDVNKKEYKSTIYTSLFYQNIMQRKSCGICYFCNLNRPSDITLGDYWGIERTDININNDNKGVSLILCNTEKGSCLLDKVKGDLYLIPAKIKDIIQPNLKKASKNHPLRNLFENDYKKYGYDYTIKKYGFYGGWRHYRFQLISNILRCFRLLYK